MQNPKHHVLAGPLGNHVYAMKFDRYTDQMWICTENGISVYQCTPIKPRPLVAPSLVASAAQPISHPKWHYITQANGLPMNPDSLAFASNGMVLVGTQCGGLAIGTPRQGSQSDNALGWNHYQWTLTKGPWHMPLTATGNGLPGNLVNSVTTTSKNHLAVATDEGIALGRYAEQSAMFSGGAMPRALNMHLVFEHGQNFVAKVHGLWHPPKHWTAPSGQVLSRLPTEDHTTAVAWEPDKAAGGKAGYLWLGHWRTGLDIWQYDVEGKIINRWHIHRPHRQGYVEYLLDPWFVNHSLKGDDPQVGNYIQCLQPLQGGAMAVGCYGAGIRIITLPGQSRTAWRTAAKSNTQLAASHVHEPHGARPPSEKELAAAIPALDQGTAEASQIHFPWAAPLRTDWATQGDWVARYGREFAVLCTAHYPFDYHVVSRSYLDWASGMIGPHHAARDSVREWQTYADTENRRSLYVPELGHRRQTCWDDHGEAYPPRHFKVRISGCK